MSYEDPRTIQSILHRAQTIAIVGLSPNELRASHFVGYYLRRHGYKVIPVNPREESILGERSYASIAEIPEHVDVVDVFRAPDAVPAIAAEAVAAGAGALWLQYGVISPEGAAIAEQGGLAVVMDRGRSNTRICRTTARLQTAPARRARTADSARWV